MPFDEPDVIVWKNVFHDSKDSLAKKTHKPQGGGEMIVGEFECIQCKENFHVKISTFDMQEVAACPFCHGEGELMVIYTVKDSFWKQKTKSKDQTFCV